MPKALLVIFISLLSIQHGFAQQQLKTWELFELNLQANTSSPNPYFDAPLSKQSLLTAIFTGTAGEATGKTMRLSGFWDGGRTWKLRFAAPASGTWEYKTISTDKGLNNRKGKLIVTTWSEAEKKQNAIRHGFVQVMKYGREAGHYFQYADSTPFLWVGDTWWNWTKRNIKFSTFRELADDRSAKGFNVGQLFVPANGWGAESSLLDTSYTILDVSLMRRVDSMIAYANSKGITVWVHGWWGRKDLNKTAGSEKMKRWWQYLVHRLAAYNVIWVVAGEYNMENYGGLGLPFWNDLGQFIKSEDPYNRIVGIHPTPPFWSGGADAPQWSTSEVLHQEPWLDYNQSQVGHGKMANEMIPGVVKKSYATQPAKPIVVTEPWYEFVAGAASGRDIRFGAWSAVLSGAAGHSYGGGHVWLAHVPESPSGTAYEPLDKSFENNTLNYEGAVSMGMLSQFFKKIQWWKMAPHPELVSDYPDQYCLADPGNEYIAYLRWGGTCRIDLGTNADTAAFTYEWFNPVNGKTSEKKTINGGGVQFFSAPGENAAAGQFTDWVLHIRKAGASPD